MTKEEYDYVLAETEAKELREVITKFVESEFGIWEENDAWASQYSETPVNNLWTKFYQYHPDGDWGSFKRGWNQFWEIAREHLEVHNGEEEEVKYWLRNGIKYIEEVW